MSEIYQWIKVADGLPESGRAISVRLNDGNQLDVCQFWETRDYLKFAFKAKEKFIQDVIDKNGEYSITAWNGNQPEKIVVGDVMEWKYLHNVNIKS